MKTIKKINQVVALVMIAAALMFNASCKNGSGVIAFIINFHHNRDIARKA